MSLKAKLIPSPETRSPPLGEEGSKNKRNGQVNPGRYFRRNGLLLFLSQYGDIPGEVVDQVISIDQLNSVYVYTRIQSFTAECSIPTF